MLCILDGRNRDVSLVDADGLYVLFEFSWLSSQKYETIETSVNLCP